MKKVNGKLSLELEEFVATRLKLCPHHMDLNAEDQDLNVEERLKLIDDECERINTIHKNGKERFAGLPQLTNHEICHEMFWNAFRGYSRMFIQLPKLYPDINIFDNFLNGDAKVISLSCTLLTLQMLDYDHMMFRAMTDRQDKKHRDAAIEYYRPYLFSYVAEIDKKGFEKLQNLQKQQEYSSKSENNKSDDRDLSYIWLECTFNPYKGKSYIGLNGYVLQSASNIEKITQDLYIIEDQGTAVEVKKSILDEYELSYCWKDDDFSRELKKELNALNDLSSIFVYRIGNGNCVYAENRQNGGGFFFDIGFNCKHSAQKLSSNLVYNYSSTMREIFKKKPSFFILSHWDLDHIAGSFAASKGFLDKNWFAPDCYDASITAKRLAKYLDLKGNLFRAPRRNKRGRMICKTMSNKTTYKLFMGEKARCDRSRPNCEGIVIKYEDANNTVLMMGDVNYESYNIAIENHNNDIKKQNLTTNQELPFADAKIDYLIVPHHGSAHTGYKLITGSNPINVGKKAIICCTNEPCKNRPNCDHRKALEARFKVLTTESDAEPPNYYYVEISL